MSYRKYVPAALFVVTIVNGACQRREGGGEGQQPGAVEGEGEGREAEADRGAPGTVGEPGRGGEQQPVAGREAASSMLIVLDDDQQPYQLADVEILRTVEQRLDAAGFGAGPVDGQIDPQFRRSLSQFQQSKNLPATGYLDRRTADALGLDWASLSSKWQPYGLGTQPAGGQPPAVQPAPGGQAPAAQPAPGGQPPAAEPAPGGQAPAAQPAPGGQPPAAEPAPGGQPGGMAPGGSGTGGAGGTGGTGGTGDQEPFGAGEP